MEEQKKYGVIYADPPWQYKVYSKKGMGRSAESHYPTMNIEDIKALPVADLADKDCALFLWVTFPCLLEGFEVLKAWGFTYKTVKSLVPLIPTSQSASCLQSAEWYKCS